MGTIDKLMAEREQSEKTGVVSVEFEREEDGLKLDIRTSASPQEITYVIAEIIEHVESHTNITSIDMLTRVTQILIENQKGNKND